jgi:hypothetical protein
MATAFGKDLHAPQPPRLNQIIPTAALAFLAGLLLSEWANGSAIRALTDDRQHLERALLQDDETTRLARPRLSMLRLMETGAHPTPETLPAAAVKASQPAFARGR